MTCANTQNECNFPESELIEPSTSDGIATKGCLSGKCLALPRNIKSKNHISKACLAPDATADFREATRDDQDDSDRFWQSLNHTIEQVLIEVDRIILLSPKQQNITTQHHPAGHGVWIQADEHEEDSVMPECDGGLRQTNKLRRPQEEDEYWSMTATAWSQLSHARQTVLSHVGRINETTEGEQAPQGECKKCEESGAECMVFRDSVQHGSRISGGSSCSRCRFRGLTCSHASAGRLREKKRKHRAVRFNIP